MSCFIDIQVIQQPKIVFSLPTSQASRNIPYTLSHNCSAIPQCIVSTQENINVSDTLLNLNSDTPIGIYNGTITCSALNITNSEPFQFQLVKPDKFQILSNNTELRFSDCSPQILFSDSVYVEYNGGVDPSMIKLFATTDVATDNINSLEQVSWLPKGGFTFEDLLNSKVVVNLGLLDDMYTVRRGKMKISGYDPSGRYSMVDLDYTVNWQRCFNLKQSIKSVEIGNLQSLYVNESLLELNEQHGLSPWNLRWNITESPFGSWQYYCPDELCDGPKWISLVPGTIIEHSWIVLKKLRWTNTVVTNESVNISLKSLENESLNFNLVVSFVNSSDYNIPIQSTNSDQNNCNPGIISADGLKNVQISELSIFPHYSPLRPICMRKQFNQSTELEFGDIIIRSKEPVHLQVSTQIELGNISLPSGFTPIAFAGRGTNNNGQLFQLISIEFVEKVASRTTVKVILPPINFQYMNYNVSIESITALRIDPKTSQFSNQRINNFTSIGNVNPLSIVLDLNEGIYIFGIFDYQVIPIAFNQPISCKTINHPTVFSIHSSRLLITTSHWHKDYKLAVSKPSLDFYVPEYLKLTNLVYIDNSRNSDINLSLNLTTPNSEWIKYIQNTKVAAGGYWNTTYENNNGYSSDSNYVGYWGILEPINSIETRISLNLSIFLVWMVRFLFL